MPGQKVGAPGIDNLLPVMMYMKRRWRKNDQE